ncbi:MAG: HAD family hydrolase [Ignavibacteriota bacterium]|jgi:phosphoglycolate phosphatase|nr:HAD family hydrolase [Ignavibacteriota bacterium]MBW7842614.1 HAD family hydrolase [Ignavibacterium sp.]MCO6447575.1 HAD family hydrolase [Ignavibacterium album]MCZ2269730.1 HAD family hydrolase [Ignavibacteriales bacterium]MDX9711963.1 HAD family hydrolase [Ignavibacteriaceae bacterium]
MNNYKHIIWDWNGTLLNDVDYSKNIINNILSDNDLPKLSLQKYREIFTFPVQDYYVAAGLDFSKTSFEILGRNFIDEYESKKLTCSLFNHAVEVLSLIHKKGITQSVLSAYLHENLVKILDHYGLTKYFDYVNGLDNIYAGSKVNIGLKLIEKINLPGDEILFIGDTLHDAEVANAMGVDCVLIANGHQVKEKLILKHDKVFEDLNDLKKYLSLDKM